jgi:hypothetical protein
VSRWIRVPWLAVLPIIGLPNAGAAQAFEGMVTMRQVRLHAATVPPGVAPLTFLHQASLDLATLVASDSATQLRVSYYVKQGRLRSTPPEAPAAGPEYLVMDFVRGVYRIVQPTQRMVLEWTRRTATDEPQDTASLGTLQPQDSTRNINGFECAAYAFDDGAGFIELSWVTGDAPELARAFAELAALSQALGADDAADQPFDRLLRYGFPVLTITLDTDQGILTIAEVETVAEQPVDDAMFESPEGFATVSVQP